MAPAASPRSARRAKQRPAPPDSRMAHWRSRPLSRRRIDLVGAHVVAAGGHAVLDRQRPTAVRLRLGVGDVGAAEIEAHRRVRLRLPLATSPPPARRPRLTGRRRGTGGFEGSPRSASPGQAARAAPIGLAQTQQAAAFGVAAGAATPRPWLLAAPATETATGFDVCRPALPALAASERLCSPGARAGGMMTNWPAASAVASATVLPASRSSTFAFGAARPAMTASPEGSTLTTSKDGSRGAAAAGEGLCLRAPERLPRAARAGLPEAEERSGA